VRLLDGRATAAPEGSRLGLLAFRTPDPDVARTFAAVETLSSSGDLTEAAAALFASLHALDAANLDGIWAEPVPPEGLGVAIADRLRRASRRA
jgi:L-threonylcarbamoyladenylate synthase